METVCKRSALFSKISPIADVIETFRRFLEKRGLRVTRDRCDLVEAVFATHEHFSVDDLFVSLRLAGKDISRTTIYRNLPLMIECGLIRRVPDESGGSRYEHVVGHPHHDHLICLECGREIEFSDDRIERAQDEVCEQFGFMPVRHRLGIWGYCRDCSENEREDTTHSIDRP